MALTTPYKLHHYMGENADDATVLAFIQANKWDDAGDGTGNPQEGMLYYNTTFDTLRLYANGSWKTFSTATNQITMEVNGITNVLQTLLPATTVSAILGYEVIIEEVGGGIVQKASGPLEPNNTANIYDDGADVLTLAVTAGGAVTIERTAGADTFNIVITFVWL